MTTAAPAADGGRPRPAVADASRWRFARFDDGLPRAGQWRDGFAIADVDGDGRPDVVHGPARKGRRVPTVFRGDGHGHWEAWSAARFPALPYDYGDVAVGDVNGDGVPDLAFAVHLGGLFVAAGERGGTFTDASRGLDAAPRVSARAVDLVDWDGDGRLDVVAVGEGLAGGAGGPPVSGGSGLVVFLNDGDGGWRRIATTVPPGPPGAALALGDVDGDGAPDAVTGTYELGRRDLLYLGRRADGAERRDVPGLPAQSLVQDVAVGDVDRDGRPEIVTAAVTRDAAGWYGRIDVLSASGAPARTIAVVDQRAGFTAVAVGDVDGDGAPDVVALAGDGAVLPFRNDGRGGFVRERALASPLAGSCAGRHVVVADLDGDGRGEVVASFGDEADACPSRGGIAAWKLEGAGVPGR